MLRRIFVALLVAAIALPLPAVAVATAKACPMKEHASMAMEHRCCCDHAAPAASASETGGTRDCSGGCPKNSRQSAAAKGACSCVVKADPSRQPFAPVEPFFEKPVQTPAPTIALIPAALSTAQRQPRAVHVANLPPSTGLVSRPRLCCWTL